MIHYIRTMIGVVYILFIYSLVLLSLFTILFLLIAVFHKKPSIHCLYHYISIPCNAIISEETFHILWKFKKDSVSACINRQSRSQRDKRALLNLRNDLYNVKYHIDFNPTDKDAKAKYYVIFHILSFGQVLFHFHQQITTNFNHWSFYQHNSQYLST